MEQWITYGLTLASGLLVGYLLGYLNHGLTKRRDADTRRRNFRNEIRQVPLRFDDVKWIYFLKTYDESVPAVREACIKILEDIKWRKRDGFIRHRDRYCGFKHSDLQLPTTGCSPVDLPIRLKENKKMREEMIIVLKDTLEKIAIHAD